MSKLKIPLWANLLWWLCIAGVVALIAYKSVLHHLNFVQILGLLWSDLSMIMLLLIGSGTLIYGLVWCVEFLRGRVRPDKDLKASSGDMANLA